jgi:hypothetical protein
MRRDTLIWISCLALASVGIMGGARPAADPDLQAWLSSTPITAQGPTGREVLSGPYPCPQVGGVRIGPPTFPLANTLASTGPGYACAQDGPYSWASAESSDWYVQRIHRATVIISAKDPKYPTECASKTKCTLSIVRVCSISAKTTGTTPCGPAGPGGCSKPCKIIDDTNIL